MFINAIPRKFAIPFMIPAPFPGHFYFSPQCGIKWLLPLSIYSHISGWCFDL